MVIADVWRWKIILYFLTFDKQSYKNGLIIIILKHIYDIRIDRLDMLLSTLGFQFKRVERQEQGR